MSSLLSGKYYLIEQDTRFPLAFTGEWQPLTGSFTSPTGTFIYGISGGNTLYAGSTARGNNRPDHHKKKLSTNSHCNQYLQRSVNKYGLGVFYYQPLVEIPYELVIYRDEIENAYIRYFDVYRNGYNLCEFADTFNLGRKMPPKTEEYKKKRSIAMTGKGNYFFGKTHSKQTILKLKAQKHSAERIRKHIADIAKPFELISPDGKIVKGINLTKFCNENNLNQGHIWEVMQGKRRKSHKGWTKG